MVWFQEEINWQAGELIFQHVLSDEEDPYTTGVVRAAVALVQTDVQKPECNPDTHARTYSSTGNYDLDAPEYSVHYLHDDLRVLRTLEQGLRVDHLN